MGRRGEEGVRDEIRVLSLDLPELVALRSAAEARSSSAVAGRKLSRLRGLFFSIDGALSRSLGFGEMEMEIEIGEEESGKF